MPPIQNPALARVRVAPAPMQEVRFVGKRPLLLHRLLIPLPLFSGASGIRVNRRTSRHRSAAPRTS